MRWLAIALWAIGWLAPGLALARGGGPLQQPIQPLPKTTQLKSGRHADPVNVVLIGERDQLIRAFEAVGWRAADPISPGSMARFLADAVLKQSDARAPFSDNYLFGRVQDLAFERQVNGSPRQRHHIRLWSSGINVESRPLWVGAVIYDRGMDWLKLVHQIGPDVDAERDGLFRTLQMAQQITSPCFVEGIGPTPRGVSAEGERYFTDGMVAVAWLINGLHPSRKKPIQPSESVPACAGTWRPVPARS